MEKNEKHLDFHIVCVSSVMFSAFLILSYSVQAVATSADEEEQRCREWMDGYLLTIREENEAKMLTLQDCHPNKLSVAINCRVAVSKR